MLPWCCLLSSFASFERIEAAAHSLLAQLELLHGLHRPVHLLDALVRLEQGHLLTCAGDYHDDLENGEFRARDELTGVDLFPTGTMG